MAFQSNFLNTNKLLEESDFSYNGLRGYTHLYENKGAFSKSYKRFVIIFDTQSKKLKPKAWIATITMMDQTDDNDVVKMIKSFQKMSEKEIADSKGLRIKVIRFREGMSYENLAKSSPLGKFSADKLRLLNGHYPDGTPEIGDLIKIVQ